MEFETRPVSDLPPRHVGRPTSPQRQAFFEALQALPEGEAIYYAFEPRQTRDQCRMIWKGRLAKIGLRLGSRLDEEKKGMWFWVAGAVQPPTRRYRTSATRRRQS
jgi:hypothetical protein